jgi:predicted MFS family arabinose efflux permease
MILFGFVKWMPLGWRGLYLVGLFPVFLIFLARTRWLGETRRYAEQARQRLASEAASPSMRSRLEPFLKLARAYPGRTAAMCSVVFLWAFSNAPSDMYLAAFCQQALGWTPGYFATVSLVAGTIGITANLIAGWLSDRVGRRPLGMLFMAVEPVAALLIFSTLGLWPTLVCITAYVFSAFANEVVLRSQHAEMFPTSFRATAVGTGSTIATIGASLGLLAEALLYPFFGSHWAPVRILAAAQLPIALIIFLGHPETGGRVLESISPESSESASEDEAARASG